jgi:ketosteroid isomerase-like protein
LTTEEEIAAVEDRLRAAMLDGDIIALDALLDEGLVFTDQSGHRLGKAQDLEAHRSGLLAIGGLDMVEREIRIVGDVAVVTMTADIAGSYADTAFAGRFAYTRIWSCADDAEWRVIAAQCSTAG